MTTLILKNVKRNFFTGLLVSMMCLFFRPPSHFLGVFFTSFLHLCKTKSLSRHLSRLYLNVSRPVDSTNDPNSRIFFIFFTTECEAPKLIFLFPIIRFSGLTTIFPLVSEWFSGQNIFVPVKSWI